MTAVNQKDEVGYLNFVHANIDLREEELENLRINSSKSAASTKDHKDLRDFYKNAQIPDSDNPYFIRVDLADGEIRYYGYVGLKLAGKSEPVPESHLGVDNRLILSARSDGKGYTADYPENLPDLVARTRYIILDGKLKKIAPEFFDSARGSTSVVAADVVEETLDQTRHKKMKPISSTLQPDQFGITREPLSHSLAIQGPPGSGKTAVLLERLARIAFADEVVYRKGMLLIGPNKAFMDYVSSVLPALGESEISMISIDQLSQFSKSVTSTDLENYDLAYLKGCEEMRRILENLVSQQAKVLSKTSLLKVQEIPIEFSTSDSLALLNGLQEEGITSVSQMRRIAETRIKNILADRFTAGWRFKHGNLRGMQFDPATLVSQESAYRTIVRNMFPPTDPVSLLGKLKTDATLFVELSRGIFAYEDQIVWLKEIETQDKKITHLDVPILDYLDYLLNESPKKWGHIAIDEAQDLTPMELSMISRRLDIDATISVAGDLAQATGIQYYETWEHVLLQLEQELNFTEKQLRRSYRVPSEILGYAQQFLDASKVVVAPSEPFLGRPDSLRFIKADNPSSAIMDTIALAKSSLAAQESLLIIASNSDREVLRKHSFQDNGNAFVRIMEPIEVKGLEFDAVIIVNPERILEDFEWGKSYLARLFYVLTTRSTKRLTLIGSDMRLLKAPLIDLPEDDYPDPRFPSDATELAEEEASVDFDTGRVLSPISTPVDITYELKPKDISILEICQGLNIKITQASGDFTTGYWIFAGTSQIRCFECGEKPQLVFVRHSLLEQNTHLYAVGCPGCFVVRSYDSSKFGELNLVESELKTPALLQSKCPYCKGE